MLEMSCISFQFLYIFLDPAQTITMIVKNFIQCGFIGWGAELIWTSLHNRIQNHDKRWMGHSSLFMFPIYGMAALFKPCSRWLRSIRSGKFSRGMIYMIMIFLAEYSTGFLLKKADRCPWDYSDSPLNVNGLIRLDYAPCWFALGLFYEGLLCRHDKLSQHYVRSESFNPEKS